MKLNNFFVKKQMFILLIALSVVLGSSIGVFAQSNTPNTLGKDKNQSSEKVKKYHVHNQEKMKNNLDKVLNDGVNSKIITEDEKSKIFDYYNSKVNSERSQTAPKDSTSKVNLKGKSDFFSEIADKNIISSDKATKLKTIMHDNMVQSRLDGIKKKLDTLVSEKTITLDQENKIIDEFKKDYKSSGN